VTETVETKRRIVVALSEDGGCVATFKGDVFTIRDVILAKRAVELGLREWLLKRRFAKEGIKADG